MLSIRGITGGWFGRRAGRESRARAFGRRRRRDWGIEALEGRALLSSFYLVTTLGDAGTGMGLVGDLRYAINQADHSSGDSTILFSPTLDGQTINLSSGVLTIDKPSGALTILGPGADELAISGGHQSQVLAVSPGSEVRISGLTVTGGIAMQGGGISNDGELAVAGCTISGNSAMGYGGGGILNGPLGAMTISGSTISDNVSNVADGGGIANAGTMTIIQSTVSGNACRGGGINGGGIANAGIMAIGDSTVSGNRALYGSGGGIANTSSLMMADDTVSNNTAGVFGGGVANQATTGGTIAMDNTIVADNVSVVAAGTDDVSDSGDFDGSHLMGAYDLVGEGDMGGLAHTLAGVAAQLGPLQDNGGPTWTQALLPGSPAIGAGDTALVPAAFATDQRGTGYARVVHGRVDIGAFEVQATRGIHPRSPVLLPPLVPSSASVMGLTILPPSPSSPAERTRIGTAGAPIPGSPGAVD